VGDRGGGGCDHLQGRRRGTRSGTPLSRTLWLSNGCLPQLISPKLYLNGEPVQLPEDKLGNIGRLYEAFAKDDKGGYNDWDHAVRVHRIVDAVERSCREGKRTRYL
jgi:hypothetical protein